jgi:hypothetical protein|tara:strand:+ start:1395 stop:1544 length:150 start_codon:yes stop_codon:yes gene_type:complete
MNEQGQVEKLQNRESELWEILRENLSDKNLENVGELIEVNFALEELCNQ